MPRATEIVPINPLWEVIHANVIVGNFSMEFALLLYRKLTQDSPPYNEPQGEF